jgi:hypothetical protein
MIHIQNNIGSFFEELLVDIKCQPTTRIYITSIYGKYKSVEFDFSQDSLTLLFSQARNKQDFLTYQNIGDWVFFSNTWAPTHLRFASKDYYDTLAQMSYYSCYRMTNRQWKLFEELADNFNFLEDQVREKIENSSPKIF